MRQYVRRKTANTRDGHQYRTLNVDGKTYGWTARHRKDCSVCVHIHADEFARQVGHLPLMVDMKAWEAEVVPKVSEVKTLLERAIEAAQDNPGLTSHYLREIGGLLRNVPVSPDGGREAELLARAGDAYCDAEYAFRNGDGVGARTLIDYAARLMRSVLRILNAPVPVGDA